jgi:hypothetical protein
MVKFLIPRGECELNVTIEHVEFFNDIHYQIC